MARPLSSGVVQPALTVLILLIAMSAAEANTANRCTEPVFGAANIAIDQRASSAAEAQQIGVEAAAETAFLQVLDRLLLSRADRDRFASAHRYDAFTDFVHISEENNLEKRYIARLDFCFDATRLRDAMQAEGLQWAELQSPSILLLPVWKDPDGVNAWLKDNHWIAGWRAAIKDYTGLVSLLDLPHSLTHERRFRGEDILAGNPIKLAAAARIANAEQIMVVSAQLDYVVTKRVVDIEARLFDKTGQPVATIISLPEIRLERGDLSPLDEARATILQKVETSWQGANLINSNATGYLLVNLPVASAKEWSSRLEALRQVAVIKDFTIRTLDTGGGTVSLALVGSREALKNALASHDLGLVDTGDTVSIIAKPKSE